MSTLAVIVVSRVFDTGLLLYLREVLLLRQSVSSVLNKKKGICFGALRYYHGFGVHNYCKVNQSFRLSKF